MRIARWTILAILLAATAFAQQGPRARTPGSGPNLQALKTYLNLTDAQVTALTAVQTSLRNALKPLAQDLAAKTKALRDENNKTTPDPNVVAQLKADIASLRGQIQAQRTSFQAQAQTLLTADQLAALTQLEQALKLLVVAREAAALDLISLPDGFGGGPGGFGAGLLRGPGGPGMMGPRRRGN
jgi:Spy/CpxP family protein refolding chaperone